MGLGVIAAVFSGGFDADSDSDRRGAVSGGAAGRLVPQGAGDVGQGTAESELGLDGGHAALLVMCDENEVQATSEYLTSLGGKARVSRRRLRRAENAAQAAEQA